MSNGYRIPLRPVAPLKPGKPPRWSLQVDGAFEGGGAKGFCYLGALDAFSRAGIWFDRVAGCSAGSITAALIAAGYEVSPKYRIDTGLMPIFDGLAPNPSNSLNQIIMDDNFDGMYDLPEEISEEDIRRSWTNHLFDRLIPFNAVLSPLAQLRSRVAGLPIGFRTTAEKTQARDKIRSWLKDKRNVPPFGLEPNLAQLVADTIVNTADWIVTPVGRAVRDAALALLQFIPHDVSLAVLSGLYRTESSDAVDVRTAKAVFREGFAILERGGIMAGDFFRNWLEAHLQARLGVSGGVTGRSANGYVGFRDLPIDLCVAAFCLDCNKMVYFSRKSTPGYSVSEAVRRSMSLPVAFVPRRLDEGHPGEIPVSLRRHMDHIVMDGGFRVDLPGWVFRDTKEQKHMDFLPRKRLVCFKLNELKPMPSKSDAGIPVAEHIEVPRLDSLLGKLGLHPVTGLNPEHYLPPGIRLILRQLPATVEALTSREEEIKANIGVWENTGIVDIGVKEMGLTDPRPWMFNLSKKGKKWMGKSGWEAALAFLRELPADIQRTLKIPHTEDPYGGSG